ncbi:MAG: transposase [Chloroflexota bacterium]|nr:transposase [Chloroflexota bacterium]
MYEYLSELEQAPNGLPGKARGRARPPKVRLREWRQQLNRPASELSAEETKQIAQVCEHIPVLQTVYDLVQQFGRLIREQERNKLDSWLTAALGAGVAELARFAQGLQQDYAAVAAAVELPWSNGRLEGHVNRLKAIKRSMYGRAKFDLLRKRVLCAT